MTPDQDQREVRAATAFPAVRHPRRLLLFCLAGTLLLLAIALFGELGLLVGEFVIEGAQLREAPWPGVERVDLRGEPFGTRLLEFAEGDHVNHAVGAIQRRGGFELLEGGVPRGPGHLPLDVLAERLGGGYSYQGRSLFLASAGQAESRPGREKLVFRGPVAPHRWVTAFALLGFVFLLRRVLAESGATIFGSRIARAGVAVGRQLARPGVADAVAFLAALVVGGAFLAEYPRLSIPNGPLVSGVGIRDARFWSDAAVVLARGGVFDSSYRPGYAYLLSGLFGIFGEAEAVPWMLNLVCFAATAALVYRLAAQVAGTIAAVVAWLFLMGDLARLEYLRVSNTEHVATFLYALFVMGFLVVANRCELAKGPMLGLGLVLAAANLVKVVSLPAFLPLLVLPFAKGRSARSQRFAAAAAAALGFLLPLASLGLWGPPGGTELSRIPRALSYYTAEGALVEGQQDRGAALAWMEEQQASAQNDSAEQASAASAVQGPARRDFLGYGAQLLQGVDRGMRSEDEGRNALFLAFCWVFLAGSSSGFSRSGRGGKPDSGGRQLLTAWIGAVSIWLAWLWIGAWVAVTLAVLVGWRTKRREIPALLVLAAAPLASLASVGFAAVERHLISVTWLFPVLLAIGLTDFLGSRRDGGPVLARERSIEGQGRSLSASGRALWAASAFAALLAVIAAMRPVLAGRREVSPWRQLTMVGEERWAIPQAERSRLEDLEARGLGPYLCERGARQSLFAVLEADPLATVSMRSSLRCLRFYADRHFYRIAEGQMGFWSSRDPSLFDRAYANTQLRAGLKVRFDGSLEDAWKGRAVVALGRFDDDRVFDVLVLASVDDGIANRGQAPLAPRVARDPRHWKAVVGET